MFFWKLLFLIMPALFWSSTRVFAQQQKSTTATIAESKPVSMELPLHISILYFDQSSNQLRPGVRTALDSIAQVLISKPTLMAAVTGYTDSIGKPELNRILAQERARNVEQYLKKRGVSSTQLTVRWEGSQTAAPAKKPRTTETISRRVVVQLYPGQ